jgi:hypothetical protein
VPATVGVAERSVVDVADTVVEQRAEESLPEGTRVLRLGRFDAPARSTGPARAEDEVLDLDIRERKGERSRRLAAGRGCMNPITVRLTQLEAQPQLVVGSSRDGHDAVSGLPLPVDVSREGRLATGHRDIAAPLRPRRASPSVRDLFSPVATQRAGPELEPRPESPALQLQSDPLNRAAVAAGLREEDGES